MTTQQDINKALAFITTMNLLYKHIDQEKLFVDAEFDVSDDYVILCDNSDFKIEKEVNGKLEMIRLEPEVNDNLESSYAKSLVKEMKIIP